MLIILLYIVFFATFVIEKKEKAMLFSIVLYLLKL